jgi:hypothetical protein
LAMMLSPENLSYSSITLQAALWEEAL